jgi:hypothetical protein
MEYSDLLWLAIGLAVWWILVTKVMPRFGVRS